MLYSVLLLKKRKTLDYVWYFRVADPDLQIGGGRVEGGGGWSKRKLDPDPDPAFATAFLYTSFLLGRSESAY